MCDVCGEDDRGYHCDCSCKRLVETDVKGWSRCLDCQHEVYDDAMEDE